MRNDTRLRVVSRNQPKEPAVKVRIQVIKVYDVEIDTDDSSEAIMKAYEMQTTEIEATGRLVDAMTDHAETEDEVEENSQIIRELQKAKAKD